MIAKLRPAPLAFGLALIVIGVFGILIDADVLDTDWIWPIAFIALGAAGFIAIAARLLTKPETQS